MAIPLLFASCKKEDAGEPSAPARPSREMSEDDAISYLQERGNGVSRDEDGVTVILSPYTESQEVTIEDIEAVNALTDVVEFRVIVFAGVAPEIFERLRAFPTVKVVAVHYKMPAETLAHFDRFPNVEKMLFWADQYVSCDHLPALQELRILHHESSEGDFTFESVKRIAACRNLEEIEILRPVSAAGIDILKALPNLKRLEVNETVILSGGENVVGGNGG